MNASAPARVVRERLSSFRRQTRILIPPSWRSSVELGAPIMLTVWVNMGMSVTDTWMVTQLGSAAVAAVAVSSDLKSIVFYFFAGVLGGLLPALANAVAAGNERRVNALWCALWIVCAACVVLAVPLVWFAPDYLELLGTSPALLEMGAGYTHYVAGSLVPLLGLCVMRTLLTAHARTQVYFVATLWVLPLNGVLNAVLIHGAGPIDARGVDGAGLATLLSACTIAVLVFFKLERATGANALRISWSASTWGDVLACCRLGAPIGVSALAEVGIFLGATLYLASLSSEAVAAHTMTLKLAGLAYAIPLALMQVATVRMAQAPDASARRQILVTQFQLAAFSAALLCIVLLSVAAPVADLLRDGSELGEQAARIAWGLIGLLALSQLIEPFTTSASGLLRARDDTFVPMLISAGAYWCGSVPLALVFAPTSDNVAGVVWLCLLAGMFVSAVALGWRLWARYGEDWINTRREPSEPATGVTGYVREI